MMRDKTATLVSDSGDRISFLNDAAAKGVGAKSRTSLAAWFSGLFADASRLIYALQSRAAEDGTATEDVETRAGVLRVTATLAAPDVFVWRVEDLEKRPSSGVASAQVPMLTLGRNGAVLSMNETARSLTGKRVRSLSDLVTDLPVRSGDVHTVVTQDGEIHRELRLIESGAGREELLLLPPRSVDLAVGTGITFDTLPVALIEVSAKGDILRANAQALGLINAKVDLHTRLADVMEGLGRPIDDWLAEAAAGRGLHRSEFLRLSRADREMFVQVTLNKMVSGPDVTLVAVLNDATELKTLEAQFVQSQKMQAIGQLAGGVAHDFNNLLTAISGHCDLLLLRHDKDHPDYPDLVQINQNANRAAALVGQLLAFSRKQTLRPQALDLRDTLSDLTHLLNRLVGERVTLTFKHDPELAPIRADKRQLEQVIMNLVVNARDSMPSGGAIRIETLALDLDQPLERDRTVVPPGRYATVKVIDHGVGIPQDKQQKIFEPFYSSKKPSEGTGLGLSTVYGIVKQTGGFVFVDSVSGHGSCFTIFLPIHVATARMDAASPEDPHKTQTLPLRDDGVVLLVEDEAPVRAFAARALRLRGYTVIEAENAEAALEALEDPRLKVDVFVTDVVMPGLDGPTWVQQALKSRPDTKVIFVSGYAEDVFKNGQVPVDDAVFLQKPFSLMELTETVHGRLH
ncbi:MAG: ATP-binding protein [Rhodobacteraceae bacterium]|nr:ATP-binding protein [Paracoccaceae bacterium]